MEQNIPSHTEKQFFATVQEYLCWEERAESKHEYHNGEVIAVAGGKVNHNTVCLNITSELRLALRGKSCRPFNSENKVWIARRNRFYYPEAFVICGEIQFYEDRQDIVTNPVLIFEVLSESTELLDRGEKFKQYMSLANFQEYVLVNPESVWAEVFYRKSADEWQYVVYRNLQDTLHLQSIDVHIPLAELYEQVSFEAEEQTL